LTVGHYIFFNP
jgi:hypothetical protein